MSTVRWMLFIFVVSKAFNVMGWRMGCGENEGKDLRPPWRAIFPHERDNLIT